LRVEAEKKEAVDGHDEHQHAEHGRRCIEQLEEPFRLGIPFLKFLLEQQDSGKVEATLSKILTPNAREADSVRSSVCQASPEAAVIMDKTNTKYRTPKGRIA
jgi:hypothetical protein